MITVDILIKELQKYDGELPVVLRDPDTGWSLELCVQKESASQEDTVNKEPVVTIGSEYRYDLPYDLPYNSSLKPIITEVIEPHVDLITERFDKPCDGCKYLIHFNACTNSACTHPDFDHVNKHYNNSPLKTARDELGCVKGVKWKGTES